jgi:GcrA cell cycle regulator
MRKTKEQGKAMQSDDWKPEHSAALCEHLAKGMSFSATAEALNAKFHTAYTRNATISRARRMGLTHSDSDRPNPPPQEAVSPEFSETKWLAETLSFSGAWAPRTRRAEFWRIPPVFESEPAKLRCADVVPRHLALTDLAPDDCRYPYGGDSEGEVITFCGHPQRPGSSYCAAHFDLTCGPGTPAERAAVPAYLLVEVS